MNKFVAAPVAVIFLIGAALIASSPAQASSTATPPGQLNASVGCAGNLKTVVPSDAAVAAEGIEAVYKTAGIVRHAKNPHVNKTMKKVLANHPKWISAIHCGPGPDKSTPGAMGTPVPEAATAQTTTTGLAATPVDNVAYDNWSGYVLDGVDWDHNYITQVGGGWTVPSVPVPLSGYQQSASE